MIPFEPDMFNNSAGKLSYLRAFSVRTTFLKKMIDRTDLRTSFEAVKAASPLVHNITNYVAMNYAANALLAIGASPVMAHAVEEMKDMVSIASALTVNIGTFDSFWIDGMIEATTVAKNLGKPWVLDPVGAGATPARTELAWRLIRNGKPSVIRGNASEIMALAGAAVKSKGVDSSAASSDAVESAIMLAKETGCVVAVSGPTDYITDGERVETITNGDPIMSKVTVMGCTETTLIGAFCAVCKPFEAALYAFALEGVAGERAARISKGTGTMTINFLDELYSITPEEVAKEARQ